MLKMKKTSREKQKGKGSQNCKIQADNILKIQNKCSQFTKMLLETSQRSQHGITSQ